LMVVPGNAWWLYLFSTTRHITIRTCHFQDLVW
jgi:hypothetical protein